MQFITMVFGKIGSGLLYGIGFGLVVFLCAWGSSVYFERQYHENIDIDYADGTNKAKCRNFKRCEEISGLNVTITTERISDDEFILLGNVKNSGGIKWTSVKVRVELFDADNNFIDECSEYIDQKVFPDSTINFKLSCSNCSKVNLEQYDSYKVSIIDANTY